MELNLYSDINPKIKLLDVKNDCANKINYKINKYIGAGMFGTVFSLHNNDHIIIKIIPFNIVTKSEYGKKQFGAEVANLQIASSLGVGPKYYSHGTCLAMIKTGKNIVQTTIGYIILEKLQFTLFELFKKRKETTGNYKEDMKFAQEIDAKIVQDVRAFYEFSGLVNFDTHMRNVMVRSIENPVPVIIDWGLLTARLSDPTFSRLLDQTQLYIQKIYEHHLINSNVVSVVELKNAAASGNAVLEFTDINGNVMSLVITEITNTPIDKIYYLKTNGGMYTGYLSDPFRKAYNIMIVNIIEINRNNSGNIPNYVQINIINIIDINLYEVYDPAGNYYVNYEKTVNLINIYIPNIHQVPIINDVIVCVPANDGAPFILEFEYKYDITTANNEHILELLAVDMSVCATIAIYVEYFSPNIYKAYTQYGEKYVEFNRKENGINYYREHISIAIMFYNTVMSITNLFDFNALNQIYIEVDDMGTPVQTIFIVSYSQNGAGETIYISNTGQSYIYLNCNGNVCSFTKYEVAEEIIYTHSN